MHHVVDQLVDARLGQSQLSGQSDWGGNTPRILVGHGEGVALGCALVLPRW
ncbi:hypothetical protein [Streptomyces sp. NPDC050485]|uniref:hypothetical protein n=1 Tax=Streptomyces sp. NPDC050485 TaxID=3365617 RepID=UPI00378BF964